MSDVSFLPARIIAGRPRLFAGALCGVIASIALRGELAGWTMAIVAWDVGVLVFLILTLHKFLTETPGQMPLDAEAQQEGEWTIFTLTIAGVTFSFAAIVVEFANTKDLVPGLKSLHAALVATTLLLSWVMLQATFAYLYAREYYYYETAPGRTEIDADSSSPGPMSPTT